MRLSSKKLGSPMTDSSAMPIAPPRASSDTTLSLPSGSLTFLSSTWMLFSIRWPLARRGFLERSFFTVTSGSPRAVGHEYPTG